MKVTTELRSETVCKKCGTVGMKVIPLTLGAHVKEQYWNKIDSNFYFCPSSKCRVVYFNNAKDIYLTITEVKTRIGVKEDSGPKPLCYCNRVTDEMLRKAIIEEKCCTTLEDVQTVTKAGKGRWCITTNPSGRCCEWYIKDIINAYLRQVHAKAQKVVKNEKHLKMLVLNVTGMTCQGCVEVVKANLESMGAIKVIVSLNKNRAELYVPKTESAEKFIKAVKNAGYDATVAE